MQCPRCKHENPPPAKFCLECGSRLALACAQCGTALPAGAKFCLECGQPVSAPPGRSPSLQAYTPKHLVEKILSSKGALEGERKQVTVLFADLKGSMALLADRDPEEARRLLDPVLERMMEAVHHYEGTVNQVMGDGIMALFGAPIGHEDHAVRACYAALRMQRRVNLYADEIRQQGGMPVEIRVGVNSGEVVVRAIGGDLHMDYTAVGQTTHLAARMEQLARAGSVLITGATLTLAEGFVQVRPLGAVPVKGLETPTPAYELTGTVATRSRLQASAARGLTRFIGRDRELEQLGQALERAAAGHGQAVAVVGEAGVGKSRLAWEFTRSHRTQGWLVLESGSVSYGKATPYLPVIELLKSYCRIQERDDPRVIRERVAGKLLTLDRALEALLTPLLALLDIPVEDAAWADLDPSQRRQRTLDAIKRLLLRESQLQPLLLLFEDLHWIDAETQALLDSLMESLPTARVLLLVNYRPDYRHAWGSKTYYLQLRIDPLPPENADTLLDSLLGEDPTLAPLKQVLIARTEGNPFFLEESVRTLAETRVLVGERGAYRVTTAPHTWQIPATAQALLAARIDRVAPEDKQLLQAAAVIGKDVPFALLQAVADVPEDALRRGLGQLQAAEFLYETSLFPDLEYSFKHAFTHEVAYASVLRDRRRPLHARLVDAIAALYPDRLAEHVERLAHHAFRGERWEEAVTYLRQAGTKAMARSANREAVAYFEQSLVALTHRPATRESIERAIDVRLELRNALLALGENERIGEYLREAKALAEGLQDQRRLGRVSALLANTFTWIGDHERAVESGSRALDIADALNDLALQVATRLFLGFGQLSLGEYRRAVACFEWINTSVTGDLINERFGLAALPSVQSRGYLAGCHAELGEFVEGIAQATDGVRIAEAIDHPFSISVAIQSLGLLYLAKGDLDRAGSALRRALEVQRASESPQLFVTTAAGLGFAHALSNRVAEGLPLLEQALEQADAQKRTGRLARLVVWLSEAQLLADRGKEALRTAERALRLARAHREQAYEAHALRLLGDIAARAGSPSLEEAQGHYHAGLALADRLSMRPVVAHCHLGLGKLYRRTGTQDQARAQLATATTLYREMDMRFWLEQGEVELRQCG
jgi:predicted ATPase/class 3 adenylate cyclase